MIVRAGETSSQIYKNGEMVRVEGCEGLPPGDSGEVSGENGEVGGRVWAVFGNAGGGILI